VLSSTCKEDDMSEMEMKDDVETEEFIDELSDEALDRELGEVRHCTCQVPVRPCR
jgi:hypothetical protein